MNLFFQKEEKYGPKEIFNEVEEYSEEENKDEEEENFDQEKLRRYELQKLK